MNTQARGGISPCSASHASTKSMVRRKSGSSSHSCEQSRTQASAMKFSTAMVSVALFGRSLPDTQWIGASKWVPVCSPQEKLFQYHAGPRSS